MSSLSSELYDRAKDKNGDVTVESAINAIKQYANVPIKKGYDLAVTVKQLANGKGVISVSSWDNGFPSLAKFLEPPSPASSSSPSPPFSSPKSAPSSPFLSPPNTSKFPRSPSSKIPAVSPSPSSPSSPPPPSVPHTLLSPAPAPAPVQQPKAPEAKIPRVNRPKWAQYLAEAEKLTKKRKEEKITESEEKTLDKEVARQLLEGYAVIEGIPKSKKVVRVFTSSTFTDTEAERNLLMVDVFPYLMRLCQLFEVQFEIVDMRWGVREFTNDDHGTFNLCMSELAKCKAESMGPAFFCLLGDKYGFRPFPNKIVQPELDQMWEKMKIDELEKVKKDHPAVYAKISAAVDATPLATLWEAFDGEAQSILAKEDLMLVPRWYKLDSNSVPPAYVLQTITTFIPQFRSSDGAERNAASSRWWKIFEELTRLLRIGSAALPEAEREKYFISVTEAEVHNGILLNKERDYQSYCNRRQITDAVNFPPAISSRPKFVDVMPNKSVDTEAHDMLEELKMKKVPRVLPVSNIIDYTVSPTLISAHELSALEQTQRDEYLESFADSTCDLLVKAIFAGHARNHVAIPPLYSEIMQQYSFCSKKRTNITAPKELLKSIFSYVSKESDDTHVVWGESGSGKTSLVALVIQLLKEQYPSAHVVYRFIGISPASSSARELLQSIYEQIVLLITTDNNQIDSSDSIFQVPSDFKTLSENLPKLLSFASTSKPLFIILDSLDQLTNQDDGLSLRWVPWKLPPNVHLIVSILPSLLEVTRNLHKGGDDCYTKVPRMNPSDGLPMLQNWLSVEKRTLTAKQQGVAMDAFSKCPLPLYLRVATDIMLKWPSYLPVESSDLAEDLPKLISKHVFHQIELIHGEVLVSHALGYISASKEGLSCSELEGVLSCDEDVLRDVYQWWTPPTRVLPPMLWKRIRDALGGYLVEHGSSNAVVYKWYHRQFWEAAEIRYLSSASEVPILPIGNGVDSVSRREARHIALAKYFNGNWSSPKLVPYIDKTGKEFESDRLITPQPLKFSNTIFNTRKLVELPYHQTMANLPDEFASTLYNFEFISAKIAANLQYDLLQDYNFAIEKIDSQKFPEHVQRLKNYRQFLARNMHILVKYPDMVLQLAFNGPESEQVTQDAQVVALTVHTPMFQWINKEQNVDPCLRTIPVEDSITDFVVTPDDKKVIVSTWSETIRVHSFENGAEVGAFKGHTDSVARLRITANGKKLLSCSHDGCLIAWDITSSEILFKITDSLRGFDVSPDGKLIIAARFNSNVKIWNCENGALIHTLEDHGKKIESCAYSSRGDMFATASEQEVFLWKASTYELIRKLPIEKYNVKHMKFSLDGQFLVMTDSYSSFVKWNVSTGELLSNETRKVGYSGSQAMTQYGDKIVIAYNNSISVLDSTTIEPVGAYSGHSNQISQLRMSSDGRYLVSGGADCTIKIWDTTITRAAEEQLFFDATEYYGYCYFSSDGKTLLYVGNKCLRTSSADNLKDLKPFSVPVSGSLEATISQNNQVLLYDENSLKIFSLDSGDLLADFPFDETLSIRSASMSNDGNFIVASFSNCQTIVYDCKTQSQVASFQGFMPAGRASISRTGDKIARGGYDGTTTIFNVQTNEELVQAEGAVDGVLSACFSPNGKLVAVGSFGRNIMIWSSENGELVHTLNEYGATIKFVKDNVLMVIGDDLISVYELAAHEHTCVARFVRAYAENFTGGDMFGNRIVALDNGRRAYDLYLANYKL